MEEFLLAVLEAVTTALVLLAMVTLPGLVREREAYRRRASGGRVEHVPVRLRGVALQYPGFWRAGRLEVATGLWRPRGGWGPNVRLSGATMRSLGVGDDEADGLPQFADGDSILTCVDGRGRLFQLATVDRADASFVSRRLRKLTAVGADSANTPLRWLQHRVPVTAQVILLFVALWLAFWLVPLLGAEQVTAEVVENRGGDYLCEVVWSGGGHGYYPCGDQWPGEHVDITVMGWPRTSTAEDPETAYAVGIGISASTLIIPTVLLWKAAAQRRRLRDLERAHAAA